LPLPAAPSSGRVSVDLSPAASGSAYYDANTVEHVTIDGTPDIVATSPASRWFQVSGSTGSVVVAVDWPAEWNASTYYKDDKTIDPNDTGDKMSYGDPGVLVTQPGLWIDVALVAYILSPNQPRVGAAYSDRFRQPLQVQTADQRFGGSPTVTSIASSTPTRTPTPTRTVVPSRTPVWAHHVCLPVIVRMH
jgi:hypothetical protein